MGSAFERKQLETQASSLGLPLCRDSFPATLAEMLTIPVQSPFLPPEKPEPLEKHLNDNLTVWRANLRRSRLDLKALRPGHKKQNQNAKMQLGRKQISENKTLSSDFEAQPFRRSLERWLMDREAACGHIEGLKHRGADCTPNP